MNNNIPIAMAEEYWKESHFSIARFYGSAIINGYLYTIVNKEGKDIFECSYEAEKAGRDKAIEPGEPADLVRADWIPVYRAVGRDRFFLILRESNGDLDKARDLAGIAKKRKRNPQD